MQIHINNSLTRKIEEFKPLDGRTVRMYSCGPTVYNYAHIGNMRSFLFADLLQRILRVVGNWDVRWVMNITNIDDKTIRDSNPGSPAWKPEMGIQTDNPRDNLSKFTFFYEKAFLEDISSLGIDLGNFYAMPRAVDHIPQMQDLILKILDKGIAYLSEGSVYFNVGAWRNKDKYGKLFNVDFENFRAGTRIDSDQYDKEQVSDFVLWKARKEDEPYWDFKIGEDNYPGRPGWHVECSAMEAELLGLPFDIHTGGIDLKFPHHEDEIAQSKAAYGVEPTVFWCHNEFLEVEGRKMSKSLGNYYTLRDLLDKGIDPLDIRFAILSAHYASTYNFTFDGISAARKGRFRVQDFIYALHDNAKCGTESPDIDALRLKIFSELANDIHTPKALAHLFAFINNSEPEKYTPLAKISLLEFFGDLSRIFGVWDVSAAKAAEILIPEEILSLAEQRFKAKLTKNFIEADSIRKIIEEAGYIIKDTKDSYSIEKK